MRPLLLALVKFFLWATVFVSLLDSSRLTFHKSMDNKTDIRKDRIHSTAKVHALDKLSFHSTGQTSSPSSATTSRPPPHNALSSSASTVPVALRDPEKQLDGTIGDASPSSGTNVASASARLPPEDTKDTRDESAALETTQKPSLGSRAKAGSHRFVTHTRDALCHSWFNVLLIFVPIGIAVNFAPLPESSKPTVVFAMNAVAIIPLAGLLSHATESVASRMGDTLASLLNVTFGNAVELIIFIIALAKNEIRIVQASILGSILANLLLILGMAFTLGGLRYREQIYNSTVTQMSACLLSLSVVSLLLPTAFHASFSNYNTADDKTLKISRGTSVILLLVYVLYLLFQLKSHAYMYESTPQEVIDEESHPGVLADMMNSDSDTSSSSSSSDSDSSSDSGSHTTAKRRIKRAFRNRRHRKSSTSSTQGKSLPSVLSSPSTERPSGIDPGTPKEGYFDTAPGNKQHSELGTFADKELDLDGQPRVRDFEVQQGDSLVMPGESTKGKIKRHAEKHKKSKHKPKKLEQAAAREPVTSSSHSGALTQVDFVEEPEEIQQPPTTTRRAFPFRPPLPSVLTNTVFSSPPPPKTGRTLPLSAARANSSNLRRTSSLPDRLNATTRSARQYSSQKTVGESSHGPIPVEADTSAKDKDDEEGPPMMSRTAAVVLLLVSTGLVAFCAELLVDVIPQMVNDTSVSQAFIGLIVLPIVGNAAEHVTAVTVAAKNKMDLAIGVAVGSSIQIALFITPVVVLIGWIMDKDMSLYFNLFETVSLFVTAFVVNFLVLDGRSNYLEGSLLMAAYVIIAVAAFFYPNQAEESAIGGGSNY